jgi:hypothetical protein
MTRTANLQMTVKDAARLMNVSERMVYMARELLATGCEDLCEGVQQGRMSLLAAVKAAKPEKYLKTRSEQPLSRLKSEWQKASEAQRATFLQWLGGAP